MRVWGRGLYNPNAKVRRFELSREVPTRSPTPNRYDAVKLSARSAIRGLWVECATLRMVALENRRNNPGTVKKTADGEGDSKLVFDEKRWGC